jgi:thiosulfate dehydrogenase (quinone) large subunit
MTKTDLEKALSFAMRIALGWVFLYAGYRQVFLADAWSAAGFLKGAKTFQGLYAFFGSPDVVPYVSVLVKWGHLLIGLSLVSGLMVRISAGFGAALMLMYYFPRMDFPYVDGVQNFIVEYHLVYAIALVFLAAVNAGRIWGLDGLVDRVPAIGSLLQRRPQLRLLFG